ncbi:MAG: DUF2804 family protein [Thermoleophilia bacterium]|nr:DUF2804 family protein [Thermoleophilia bacterium]
MTGPIVAATPETERRTRLSWRGPGGDRPDLPLPPAALPLLHRGTMRKRWRYVGYYGDEVMLCAATVLIGPFRHTFWSLWDRQEGVVLEHTRLRPGRAEVAIEGNYLEIRSGEVRASLVLGHCQPVEVVCPSGRGWGWTRKRAGVPMAGRIQAGGRSWRVDGLGVDDESAGYQARRTSWFWSAGIGTATDGRSLGWNLVSGINDPPTGSERSIWIDGVPAEAEPVVFDGLESVIFSDGNRLEFEFRDEAERRRHDNFGLVRSDYVHRFGAFSGSLAGIELEEGSGVMERHSAVW